MKSTKILILGFCLFTTSVFAQKSRKIVADGERAYATIQVQNLMSKHEYYHAADMNKEEVDALWVDAKGANAATATFASPGWVMNGIATIRGAYGEENHKRKVEALEKISKIDTSVKNIPANLGAGHEWVMHTSTTPVIEVAGDGKTAKGIWYSPGMGLMPQIKDGKVVMGGTFFWEKYGGDFIKENGVWKIWHLQMAYDFTPQVGKDADWFDFSPKGPPVEAGEQKDNKMNAPAMPSGFTKPKYSYPAYSPKRGSVIYPPLPEPYYTFSETFTY
jgi:SnoaL-like domain